MGRLPLTTMRTLLTRLVLAVVLTVSGWTGAFAATGAPFAAQTFQGVSSPQSLSSLAAWYDISDVSSLRNAAGAVPSTGEAIKLVGDKSGNSSVNVLCLNGVAGNYASAPDSVPLSITGDIDIRVNVALDDWTPAADQTLAAKRSGAGQFSWQFDVKLTTGLLYFYVTNDGTNILGGAASISSVAPTVSDFGSIWLRVTRASATGQVIFYTSPDASTWTQLGTAIAGASGTIFDSTAPVEIGSTIGGTTNRVTGRFGRAQIYNGINGTLAFDANFATAAKLATSFTESSSNAATVTINTSGATGARISGARDLYQGTAANQPILTIAAAGNYLTFDGSNDYLKAAPFSLPQPISLYLAGSLVSWTLNDYIFNGNAGSTPASAQNPTTPKINSFGGASSIGTISPTIGAPFIGTWVFNGAGQQLRLNRTAAVTGSGGVTAMNGFVLAANETGAAPSNITAQEVVIYSVAHTTAQQDSLIGYFARHWGIAGGFAHQPVQDNIIPFEPNLIPWKREDELIAA